MIRELITRAKDAIARRVGELADRLEPPPISGGRNATRRWECDYEGGEGALPGLVTTRVVHAYAETESQAYLILSKSPYGPGLKGRPRLDEKPMQSKLLIDGRKAPGS